jgi:hypothetical protein
VFDVSRVMRLPGTWNAKRKAKCELMWCWTSRARLLEDIEAEAARTSFQVMDGMKLPLDMENDPALLAAKAAMGTASYRSDKTIKGAASDFWKAHVRPGGGAGMYGLDEAVLITMAHYWGNKELKEDDVIRKVESLLRDCVAEHRPNDPYDDVMERKKLLEKLKRTKRKWPRK